MRLLEESGTVDTHVDSETIASNISRVTRIVTTRQNENLGDISWIVLLIVENDQAKFLHSA